MITVKLNDKKEPVEVLSNRPKDDLVSIPDLEDIIKIVDSNVSLECEYSDIVDTDTLKELLNSNNKNLISLGEMLLSMLINDYNNQADIELPKNAEDIIKFVLLDNQSKLTF